MRDRFKDFFQRRRTPTKGKESRDQPSKVEKNKDRKDLFSRDGNKQNEGNSDTKEGSKEKEEESKGAFISLGKTAFKLFKKDDVSTSTTLPDATPPPADVLKEGKRIF